jgi:hypothetical protein
MTPGSSDDRYTYPTEGQDPRDRDREAADPEERARRARGQAVTHPQQPVRSQGTSADAPGHDPSDREAD